MDLFDSQPASTPQPAFGSTSASNDMLGGFGSSPPQQQQQPQQPQVAQHNVYNKNDLSLTFSVQRNPQAVQVTARFRNTSNFDTFSNVNLQAAVPKTQRLQLQAINNGELEGGQEGVQMIRVTSVQGVSP